jgi:hypothetical protein
VPQFPQIAAALEAAQSFQGNTCAVFLQQRQHFCKNLKLPLEN